MHLQIEIVKLTKMSQMLCIDDFEKFALENLPKQAKDYYKSGANHEYTLKENRKAFMKWKIRPRFLRDVKYRDLSTTILGEKISMPICVSPTAMQRMAHPLGELANVKACQSEKTIMILSTIATSSIEEVAKAGPDAIKWFQLYIYKDREITKKLVERAVKNGFKALVLTVDTPFFGMRYADARNKFHLPSHLRMANFDEGHAASDSIQNSPKNHDSSGLNDYAASLFDPSITWDDIEWLKSISTLPIVVKGILTAEDAILALKYGASAILVSNHGARQLDGVPATIEVLPEIVSAVKGKCEVYIDGGIRTGTDVLKALALGAKAVFIGRPIIWGLAYDGVNGARQVLEILRQELDTAMALSGCATLSDVTTSLVVPESFYRSRL